MQTHPAPTTHLAKKQRQSNNTEIQLKSPGQCTFLYSLLPHQNENPAFIFYDTYHENGLKVELSNKNTNVALITPYVLLADPSNVYGYIHDYAATYWFSVDAQNRRLYAGIGEPRLETVVYTYLFQDTEERNYKKILETFTTMEYDPTRIQCIKLIKDPITKGIPLKVKNTNDLTMDDIASGSFLPHSNLSTISQKMYNCIAGKQFLLNTPEFPDFSKAIEYSIQTPGCWCNTTLKNKSTEFNKDKPNIEETYLRITLGENNGESPGVPYVMEIWPVGHYSPIHSHANADAVIRVLHGSIHVSLFPYLSENNILPFAAADFKEGDITWISPTLNQTHQLLNLKTSAETCITIQCYMYNEKDKTHYDYFDYVDADSQIQPYEPDSDMEFLQFKELMRKEWTHACKTNR